MIHWIDCESNHYPLFTIFLLSSLSRTIFSRRAIGRVGNTNILYKKTFQVKFMSCHSDVYLHNTQPINTFLQLTIGNCMILLHTSAMMANSFYFSNAVATAEWTLCVCVYSDITQFLLAVVILESPQQIVFIWIKNKFLQHS